MLCTLLFTLGAWPSSTEASYAQTPLPEEVRYTFALVGISLSDALERLIDETELSLVYESELIAGRTTFCRAERVTAEALLSCILQGTGLDYLRLSSGTYVLIGDPRAEPQYASLMGQVVDAETGSPLSEASVLLAGEGAGTATNPDGRFAFPMLRPGPHRLVVTHVAYHDASDTVYVGPEEHGRVSVPLKPRVVFSAPVVVSGFRTRLPSEELGAVRRTAKELTAAEGLGAQDIVQTLDAVVGVRLGDALSDVHVQGGASNEQQFLLDGVPIFMPVPNGGFIGPFSPFAVGQITVQKAGFGASHGSGLSGVIEVEHQLAPREGPGLTAQVDPLSLNARWNGKAGSAEHLEAVWMMALRHSLWEQYEPGRLEALFRRWATPDRFLYEALRLQEEPPLPTGSPGEMPDGPLEVGFDDLHAAARLRIGGLRSLHFSFYRGTGAFGIDDAPPTRPDAQGFDEDVFEDAYHWRNRTAQLRHEWVQSRRLFMNVGAWTTSYELVHPVNLGGGETQMASSVEFNGITEVGVRGSGDLAASAEHHLSGALEAVHTGSDFALSLDPFGTAPAGPDDVRPVRWRIAAFLEDCFSFGLRTTLTFGSRLTYLPAMQRVYGEPRLAIQYDREIGGGSWAARGAVGLYRQYLHSFDVATYNVTSLLPRMRFWLPVGALQRPPEVYHATGAFLYRPAGRWQLTAEVYYKHQPHLLVLDYGDRSAAAMSGEVLRSAEGYAYGAAFSASYEGARFQADAQYEYDVARRRVPGRFGGAFVPVPWDAPHRLYLALDARPWPHWTATLRWQGIFGRSWGFRQAYYDVLEPDPATRSFPPFDLSDPAAHRLPAFSQWNAGLAYAREVLGVGVQGRVDFINLLGQRNISDWSLRPDEAAGTYTRQARRSTPFLPTFSLRLSL